MQGAVVAVVGELISYPVKGCAGVRLTEVMVAEAGLAHDRSFMVTGPDGIFRSQRSDPRLALIQPAVSADGTWLTLRFPGAGDLAIEVSLAAARHEVTMFGSPYQAIDQGEAAAGWLSSVLGAASRLVRVAPEHDRVTDGWIPGTAGFADSGAVHAISRASLAELNRRVSGPPVPMSRFRPNIVIDGWQQPHLEDRIRHAVIGNTEFGYARLAIRCAVTMVDQRRGEKAGPEPLRTLASYRRAAVGGVAFGTKFSVLRAGKLAVGDELTVQTWAESELTGPGQD
jgi:uncharacterized protein YcbX